MKSLSGKPLPALDSCSSAAERYLAAILEELQWQRAQKTPPPDKPARSKVQELPKRAA